MQTQKTLIALGAAAYGALVSWAVTADYYERKLEGIAERVDILEHFVTQATQHSTINYYDSGSGSVQPAPYNYGDQAKVVVDDFRLTPPDEESISKDQNGSVDERDSQADPGDGTFPEAQGEVLTSSEPENPRGDETAEVNEADGTEDAAEIPPGETPEQTREKLQATIDQYTVQDDTDGQQDVAQTFSKMEHAKAPFVISRALFASDPDEGDLYNKETLTYYPQQRILLDEDEEVVDDIATVVGWKNLNRFGDQSDDMDTVFVRNQRLDTDYEVVREEDQLPPLHIQYSMGKHEFDTAVAAGVLRLREEDLVD